MGAYYTVTEYSKIVGKDSGNIRRMLIAGKLPGEKIGNQWVIPKDASYPSDQRIKSGNCRNWRKRSDVLHSNPKLMHALNQMCNELSGVYGEQLVKIVLYGSYARCEQTEESDVDIALIIKKDDDVKHNAMTDIVVDYELEQGVTLSVIPIEYEQYNKWNRALPFYINLDREGIVLWKAAS